MEISQEFKCTWKHLSCTDNDSGECECEDGSICKWKDKVKLYTCLKWFYQKPANENCPCGAKPKETKRRRRRVHDDMWFYLN